MCNGMVDWFSHQNERSEYLADMSRPKLALALASERPGAWACIERETAAC